ncbi:MAG: methylmalonyl-CoA mutase family protein [bacterium]
MSNLEEIGRRTEEWNQKVADMREKRPQEEFVTDSGIPVKRLYTPCDIQDLDYLKDVGFPGEAPFTRGIYPTMYRGRSWTMRLFSGHGTPEETNRRWKFLYENGETGFSAAVDALTFNGLDPDDERGDLEVGTTGVPLFCLDSLFALTDGIPHDQVSVALVTEPFSSAPICAMYFNCCTDKGLDLKQIRGTCQKEWEDNTLSGVSSIIGGEPYELRVVVPAGDDSWILESATCADPDVRLSQVQNGTEIRITLSADKNINASWHLKFRKGAIPKR